MPASMMRAVAGESANVEGRRRAIAPTGPMPGRIPTIVPMITPMKQAKRFTGVRATPKPYSSPSTVPITRCPSVEEGAARQRNRQQHGEDVVGNERAHDSDHCGHHPPSPAQAAEKPGHEDGGGERIAGVRENEAERDQPGD